MANSRPSSLIIPPEVFDETTISKKSKKSSAPKPGRSSSSSIDSSSTKNVITNDNNSLSQNLLRTTTTSSTTTTESDIESDQDDSLQLQPRHNDANSQEQLSRRAKHFHKLFKSEIHDDIPHLIDSYVCAYQGDILLQGKMYITDRYLCFHSRIISYVTKHVYRWEQIEDVTKERVAFIFPTAVGIQLKHSDKKISYASFLKRDEAYDKIRLIWSRYKNGTSSYDDDEQDDTGDGTLKATNNHDRTNPYKRYSYEVIDGPEQDGVPPMYFDEDNQRPVSLVSPKTSHDRSQSKELTNGVNKRTSEKKCSVTQILSNGSNDSHSNPNPTMRHSRFTKNERRQNDVTKRNSSLVNHRSKNSSSKSRQSQSQDRASSPIRQTISHSDSSPNLTSTTSTSIKDTKSNSVLTKLINMTTPLINRLTQSMLSLTNHIQTLSMKTTTFILIFLLLLFFHAFYLVKIANRIETRLQTLHHVWPSSPMSNSFVSNTPDL